MTTTSAAETTEAKARRKMAEHAAIPLRGWDSGRRRAELQAEIDALLDAWNDAR